MFIYLEYFLQWLQLNVHLLAPLSLFQQQLETSMTTKQTPICFEEEL